MQRSQVERWSSLKNVIGVCQKMTNDPPLFLPLETPLETLEFSVRASNCFKNCGLYTVSDLVEKTPKELMQLPNFGRITLKEVEAFVFAIGYHLGTAVKKENMFCASDIDDPERIALILNEAWRGRIENTRFVLSKIKIATYKNSDLSPPYTTALPIDSSIPQVSWKNPR